MSDPSTKNPVPDAGPPSDSSGGGVTSIFVMIAIGTLGVVALAAVLRMDTSGQKGNQLSDRFEFRIDDYMTVDPGLLTYQESGGFDTGLRIVRGIAVGPEDQVFVVGDGRLVEFSADGDRESEIALSGEGTCVAIAGPSHKVPGRRYVGVENRIEVYDSDGRKLAVWESGLDDKSLLTSIAVGDEEVYVADAGNRIVLRFDLAGTLLNRIGEVSDHPDTTGFVIPSPYFDVATGDDGLLRVVNPGARKIETYTPEGDLLGRWGRAGAEISGFFGCCNPSHMVRMADGRIVTSEKGIPRIKIYSATGELQCVVAEPRQLARSDAVAVETRDEHQLKAFAIAVTADERVLVLDPTNGRVRIFSKRQA